MIDLLTASLESKQAGGEISTVRGRKMQSCHSVYRSISLLHRWKKSQRENSNQTRFAFPERNTSACKAAKCFNMFKVWALILCK